MDAALWDLLRPAQSGFDARWRDFMALPLKRVRERHGAEAARFASLQAELSTKALARFPDGRIACGTSRGLAQATSADVSRYRAQRMAAVSNEAIVWDACCGLGADALALGEAGLRVLATDVSMEALRCAAVNASLFGAATPLSFCRMDATRPGLAIRGRSEADGSAAPRYVLFDPDRRNATGDRIAAPERWSPKLSEALRALSSFDGAAVKLPPGLAAHEVMASVTTTEDPQPASLEWISLDGEMKELVLWTGALARSDGASEATVLRTGTEGALTLTARDLSPGDNEWEGPLALGEFTGAWLVEFDVAVWQARLMDEAADHLDAAALDPALMGGLFVTRSRPAERWLRSWKIDGAVPADRKRVRALLREHNVGALHVKTRGAGVPDAGALASTFKGAGERTGLLAVSTWRPPGEERARKPARIALLLST